MSVEKSYGQIFKASSIMGGAAGISLLLSMIRVKFSAVLIGTAGVGLAASFTSIQGFIGTIAGLGIQSSAVGHIVAAVASGNNEAIGRTVLTLRRMCLLTGLVGLVAMALLSPMVSQLTFGHRNYAPDIAALGLIILFANISGGQMALIQGLRRITDMARAGIIGAVLGTVTAIGFYLTLGLRGIVPALVAGSAIQLALSYFFARKLSIPKAHLTLRQTFAEAGGMVRLGLVIMVNSLLASAVTYITVILITQHAGVKAVGLYSAAFALSGMFVNFVLGAMAADYYPRLTAAAGDKVAMARMVNEQTEIGLLLALPGLIATLSLAPWILSIFYTDEFIGAAKLLHWFVLGCLGRVISWPLGFVMLGLGKGRWLLLTEVSFNILHVALIFLGLAVFDCEGVAIAFFIMYTGHIGVVYLVADRLIDFSWSKQSRALALFAALTLGITLSVCRSLPLWPASVIGFALTLGVSFFCLRGLVQRIGPTHRIVGILAKLPGAKRIFIP